MRIPGWLPGLLGFIALIGATAICSLAAYAQTRQVVVDLWKNGVVVESPGDVLNALTNEDVLESAQATRMSSGIVNAPDSDIITIPTITPAATSVAAVDEPSPKPTDDTAPDISSSVAEPTPTPEATADPLQEYEWQDPRQVRILLLGIDQRTGTNEQGPFRTDTMIVLNVDPVRKTAGMISLPRDLWVNIPNFQPNRINTANSQGDAANYPGGGGPKLAIDTISSNFGIRIDHYILVNFDVFERVVNTIAPNGVEVCIDQPILDEKYPDEAYGTITVEFDPGCQALDATRLLQYARTRATQGGDFDRAERQQKTLDALRAHVLSVGGITQFITQIPTLWNELSDSYRTSLSLNELIALGKLMSEIPRENINFGVINADYVQIGKGPTGEDVLYPEYGRINGLVQRIFYPQRDVSIADLRARAENENATIRVYNGTNISGLAGRTQEWLIDKGISVAGTGNDTEHNGQPSVIRDYGNNRYTAEYLAAVLGLSLDRIEPGTDGLAAEGIIVVAGPDMQQIIAAP